jgi:hypothetical protein
MNKRSNIKWTYELLKNSASRLANGLSPMKAFKI